MFEYTLILIIISITAINAKKNTAKDKSLWIELNKKYANETYGEI